MFLFTHVGRGTLSFMGECGKFVLFLFSTVRKGICPPYYWRQVADQFTEVGFHSAPVIGMTALFTGAVLALQSYMGFSRFSAQSALPNLVVISITRELGPVIAGLMFAGRVGGTMAAEIGTMNVTEQIDALSTLSVCKYKYLYWPRIFSCFIMLPALVFIADVVGVLGGFLVSISQLGFHPATYLDMTVKFVTAEDILSGIAKAAFFGISTSLIGCFQGATATGGAAGVGRATKNAVVISSITTLLLNYILTNLLFHK
jgi:phospholipid/cholesterol/gamma-HCH transport system permease protein